jgi:transcription elongation factor GreB
VSRAFVSENDAQFEGEEVPAIKIPLPAGARNYMTPDGAEGLRAELEKLVQNEKPRLSAQISRGVAASAPSGGETDRDTLSRLRRRLREVERRIEYLTAVSARLEVVDAAGQDPTRVAFGATVTVQEVGTGADGGAPERYRIVGVDESDPAKGAISWISPLARALIGAASGDTVTVQLPDGERRLRIATVAYE